jgi:hypothetical protein
MKPKYIRMWMDILVFLLTLLVNAVLGFTILSGVKYGWQIAIMVPIDLAIWEIFKFFDLFNWGDEKRTDDRHM